MLPITLECQAVVRDLSKLDSNVTCFDCTSTDCQFVCPSLSIFVCEACATLQ